MKPLLTLLICLFSLFFIGCSDSTYKDVRTSESKELLIVAESQTWSVYKIKVDSTEYLIVSKGNGGVAIIKHSK